MDSFIRDLILSGQLVKDTASTILLAILVIWSLVWKGFALWHGAKIDERYWFVAILLLNSAGIIEIAYLFFFSKNKVVLKDAVENIKSLNFKKLLPSKSKN